MKAKIIEQDFFDGSIEALRHPGRPSGKIKRLVVEEPIGVTITVWQEKVVAWRGATITHCNVLGEVEIPDELLAQVMALIMAEEKLTAQKNTFEALMLT